MMAVTHVASLLFPKLHISSSVAGASVDLAAAASAAADTTATAGAAESPMEPPKLVYESFDTTLENVRAQLAEHGVAVVPGVLGPAELERMRTGLWDLLATLSANLATPITPDPQTWASYQELRPLRKSMLHCFGVGQSQVAWDVRQNPAVAAVFAEIWGCAPTDLLASFDGLTVHFPPELTPLAASKPAGDSSAGLQAAAPVAPSPPAPASAATTAASASAAAVAATTSAMAAATLYPENLPDFYSSDWFHVDQSYTRPALECVQGLVSAWDVEEGDSTLAVLVGSHKYFGEFARHYGITRALDWFALRDSQRAFYDERGCKRVNVLCKAGSLVLWDSRTVHCGCIAQKGRKNPKIRFVTYVCQVPRPLDAKKRDEVLAAKRESFQQRATTSHWPDSRVQFDDLPWTLQEIRENTAPVVPKLPEPALTPLGRRLAGLD